MKKLVILFLLVFSVSLLNAQNMERYLELLRMDIETEKERIITEAMKLNDEESVKFWPLFREYDFEMNKLNDEVLRIIKYYSDNYQTMVDERARELMNMSFDVNEKKSKLRRDYFKKFDKLLGATKAARFIQVERQLDQLITLQITVRLPFFKKPSDDIK
jgi:hypothetical protein